VGGAIIVFLGLALSQLISPEWLMKEKKWEYQLTQSGYLSSVIVGISFAAGWTPCIGPILGSVLGLFTREIQACLSLPAWHPHRCRKEKGGNGMFEKYGSVLLY